LQELKAEQPTVQIDRLDVTSEGEIEAVFKKYTNINVLFNCAG
jgi:short-subunit dehydrogenase involved in D-alanine esterification of teichoic acids